MTFRGHPRSSLQTFVANIWWRRRQHALQPSRRRTWQVYRRWCQLRLTQAFVTCRAARSPVFYGSSRISGRFSHFPFETNTGDTYFDFFEFCCMI